MPQLLTLRHASIAFADHVLFSGLSLNVSAGQLVGVTGESGCGKTSLLRAILGFVPFTEGEVEVCGQPLDVTHINAIRRQTAYLPQELQPAAATGRDLLRLTHELSANSRPSSSTLATVMDSLGLAPSLLDLSAQKLSGGQRQRLLLAAALTASKPLLLLDEPSSALDADSTQRVAHSLLQACHDNHRAALVVSHNTTLLSLCDSVVTIEEKGEKGEEEEA